MSKKENIYFVNTVNTGNNKSNILIYLILPMDRSLPVESTPQIDFENPRDQYVDKTSRKGDVHYFKRNSLIYSIFLITTILMNISAVAVQITKAIVEIMKVRPPHGYGKEKKRK